MNPKGELQECLQAIAPSSPTYRIIAQDGPDHLKLFVAEVVWGGLTLGQGTGNSKKEAEIAAAAAAMRERVWSSEKDNQQDGKNSGQV